ncbi:MAG: Rieske 2Fe-2S domain-containing protein [Bacteroidota bacterium]|nr:Rieske 2Fe-2S domain-containing protein [Bacteroidota bacterium]
MAQLSGKVLKTVLICSFFLTGISGCKDDYTSVVPYVTVNMNFSPTNYIEFNTPGGSVYFGNAGFGGIIVVNNWGDEAAPFLSFDAACTHEVSSTCKVTTDGSGIAECPCCGSQYMLFGGNGSVMKGPAIEPLKQYRTSYTGGRIIVRN